MKRIGIDVSVLASGQKTGVGVYCFNLIDNLLKIDKTDHFILFALHPLGKTSNDILHFKKYPNVKLKIYKLPVQSFRRLLILWQTINFPLIETLIGKVDIFHSFNTFIPPQKTGRSVATFYDLSSIYYPAFHKKQTSKLDDLRFKRMVKKSDLILTISRFSKNEFLQKWPGKKVEVIYPAPRGIFYQKINESENESVLKKYNLEKRYFLFVGTLEPRKNVERLIKAFSVFTDGGSASLVIVGSNGWLSDDIYYLPKKLGIDERVKFLDYVEDKDLPALYRSALCLIYPSLYEGFGLPAVEAFKMGIPVITSNNSSLSEIGKNSAVLIDPMDTEKITDAMRKIFTNARLRNTLIKKGRIKAKEFSWEKGARQLLKFYYLLSN